MNIPALERLRDWLVAGAPHATFDMTIGLAELEDEDYREEYWLPEGTCGTVCCIAGATVFIETGTQEMFWEDVRDEALLILGLAWDGSNYHMGNDLFDPTCAPDNCTPMQAAQAVQNVIDGKEPWAGVE